jgi:glycosyltransferase involved in cell wall biosynthesis
MWAHDHRFIKHGVNYYSQVEFPYEMWDRYLIHFNEIIVAARVENFQNNKIRIDKMNKSSGIGVDFLAVPPQNSIKSILFSKNSAKKILEEELQQCDALIARLPSQIGMLAVEVAKKLNKPYAIELVGCPWDALINLPSWKSKLYAPFMYISTKKIVSKSLYTLYVTKNFLQQRYLSYGKNIDCSNVNLIPCKNNTEKLGVDPNKKINIGLIGYLSKYKGIDTAFQAIHLIKKTYPNIQLNILGSGEKNEWIKNASEIGIEKSISIQTLPSGKPVNDWLDQQHIYIQPSRTEGLPRGLIEAMNKGIPSIGSKVGGIPELLQPDFLHNPGDYKHLDQLIRRLIQDKNLYDQQSIRNSKIALEYSKDILTQKRELFWGDFREYVEKG